MSSWMVLALLLLRVSCSQSDLYDGSYTSQSFSGGENRLGWGIEIEIIHLHNLRRALEAQLLQPCMEAVCRKHRDSRQPPFLSICRAICIALTFQFKNYVDI
nr:unnamed protein product [Mus musculus]